MNTPDRNAQNTQRPTSSSLCQEVSLTLTEYAGSAAALPESIAEHLAACSRCQRESQELTALLGAFAEDAGPRMEQVAEARLGLRRMLATQESSAARAGSSSRVSVLMRSSGLRAAAFLISLGLLAPALADGMQFFNGKNATVREFANELAATLSLSEAPLEAPAPAPTADNFGWTEWWNTLRADSSDPLLPLPRWNWSIPDSDSWR